MRHQINAYPNRAGAPLDAGADPWPALVVPYDATVCATWWLLVPSVADAVVLAAAELGVPPPAAAWLSHRLATPWCCAACAAPLVQPIGAGRPRLYCSDRCRGRARRRRTVLDLPCQLLLSPAPALGLGPADPCAQVAVDASGGPSAWLRWAFAADLGALWGPAGPPRRAPWHQRGEWDA